MAQQKETTKGPDFLDNSRLPEKGKIVSLDPGTKRVGVAICDETRTVVRPLERIQRTSWKKLLLSIKAIVAEYDAAALVIGLPLESDGSESKMSREARRFAQNFALSLELPVFLQDERVTSYEAKSRLWEQGVDLETTRLLVDSEAAVIILEDFLASLLQKPAR